MTVTPSPPSAGVGGANSETPGKSGELAAQRVAQGAGAVAVDDEDGLAAGA